MPTQPPPVPPKVKPAAAPAAPAAPKTVTKSFPCSSCGAKLEFKPGLRAMKCPYCGAETPIPEADEAETGRAVERLDYEEYEALAPREPELPRMKVKCPGCRAETELEKSITADRCAYCANPLIADGAYQTRKIVPKALAPFLVLEKQARELFTGWVKGLWFAPNALKKLARIERGLKGNYVPYFTYDAETENDYSGERGTVYYEEEEVEVNGKRETRRVERVSWMPVSGRVDVDFEDIAITATPSLPIAYADALAPWELDKLVPYADSYVSGFKVEAYSTGLVDGFERARAEMEPQIREAIERDIGGDRQRIHSVRTAFASRTFRHVLLPVWISSYAYSGKTFRFLVNGQTGLVKGERPYSVWKIAGAVILALAAAYLVYRLSQ
jgi:DNA-directed RNA polymerase subunit RPC12/RpoP